MNEIGSQRPTDGRGPLSNRLAIRTSVRSASGRPSSVILPGRPRCGPIGRGGEHATQIHVASAARANERQRTAGREREPVPEDRLRPGDGVCQVMVDSALSAGPHVKSGKLKLLGVGTENRMASWPQTPTLSESGLQSPKFRQTLEGQGAIPGATTPAEMDAFLKGRNLEVGQVDPRAEHQDQLIRLRRPGTAPGPPSRGSG